MHNVFHNTAIALSVAAVLGSPLLVSAAAMDMRNNDPSVQMERNREAMERRRFQEQIEEDLARRKIKVETKDTESDQKMATEVTFRLKKVSMNPSAVLTQEELDKITVPYLDQEIAMKDLQEMTEKINRLYNEKGYMTCKALLPPQRIHAGEIHIRLVEGRTGNVIVSGNRYTKEGYVKERFSLKKGEIARTTDLNKELQWFNGTNDAQLRMMLRAGTEPGTTDYEIIVYEPQNQTVTLYVDNGGYETTGTVREGIFYNMRSVSGIRDSLRANYLHSLGTNSWAVGYTVPLNRRGMKLDFDYSGNTTDVKKGDFRDWGIKGHAAAASMTLRVPFKVDEHSRHEAGLQFLYQKSKTDIGTKIPGARTNLTNDRVRRYSPYVSFIHYGKSSVLHHKYSVLFTNRKNIDCVSESPQIYQISLFWQKRYHGGQTLQAQLDGQWTWKDMLSSSDRFYIGGANSVRGYEESFLSGEKGFTGSLTYNLPLNKKQTYRFYTFLDYGMVSGESTLEDHILASGGVGLSATFRNLSAGFSVGIPFRRKFMGEEVKKARIHFAVSGTM
jgi:hemolysin activation/secretion protein